ncbi:MAG: zinc-ribbon domain-containing protein [Methanolinea sp.]|nr:zinc-ribbon domain-containing protein [Methanolinea sp.]
MPQTVFCTQCGKEIPIDADFCPKCGAHQMIPGTPDSPEPRFPPSPQTPTPISPPPPSPFPSSVPPHPPTVPSRKKAVFWIAIGAIVTIGIIIAGIYLVLSGSPSPISLPIVPDTPPSKQVASEPLTPVPTETVPAGTEVVVQVSKNPSNGEITFIFSGGPGQKVVRSIETNVVTEKGLTYQGSLKPVILDEITLPGTRGGTDHVRVKVTYLSGNTYTIIDRSLGTRE